MAVATHLELISSRRRDSGLGVIAIATFPSGRIAVVAAGKYQDAPEIAIWDVDAFQLVRSLPPHGIIRSVAWSPAEKILATGPGALWFGGQGLKGDFIFLMRPHDRSAVGSFRRRSSV